ncbi:MAG: glycosyltransferase [Lachnospiraceae bacterium]|nr:glycosyltransferase [Lachnospiraceae bacterium]
MNRPEGIDIIIPIYNAFDDLQKCINSIKESTNLGKHRLLLVNDASPDERILPYIKSVETDSIIVVENEKNLGFSGSINHGITVSRDRDVLLLNSDTIVTPNWIEKIIDCAYSDATIATVTPLSNNATLCSVPEFLKENTLPDGFTLNQYARLIETVSMRLYPRIPVANGFCMYIKREVIDKIGLFDMETFQRGYGEENDFCYRAEQIGYYHAMCDDTYIYHTGTTSFVSDEKKRLIEAHEKILCDRYPAQNHAVAVHCRDNPNERIQDNIKLWTGLLNGRKNLLYLVQSDFREDAHDHLGGTQLHVKDMTEVMRDSYNVFVAARNLDYLNLTAYTKDCEYTLKFYIGKAPSFFEFRSKKFGDLYGRILDTFRIDFVHIHHVKDLTLEMFYQADARHIPIVTTLHDYYSICPSIKMFNCNEELCIGHPEKECCSKCQTGFGGLCESIEYLSVWRREHRNALNKSASIITPSDNTKEFVALYYPELLNKIIVIPHGMKTMSCSKKDSSKELRVAFIGGISKEKGSFTAYQLIKNGPSDIHWYLFGVWGYNELSMLDKKNYTKTGLYERHELPGLIEKHQIDLICILPIWPETYCYTLSEAIMCGVPVIATDIGALGERMRKMECGWLVSVEHAYEEALEIILRIKGKNEEYHKIRNIVECLTVKSLEEMRDDYLEVYERLDFSQRAIMGSIDSGLYKFAVDGYRLAQGKRISIEADGEALQERMEELENQLATITGSFSYKCARALWELPLPGRRYLKKALYGIYRIVKQK